MGTRLFFGRAFVMAAVMAVGGSALGESTAANPWMQLPADYRNDLARPLNNSRHYPWAKAGFTAWFNRWYTDGGVPRPGVGPRETYFHAYYFNHLTKRDDRNSLLLVYAKLKKENLWGVVKTVKWAGVQGAMLFEPTTSQAELRRFLAGRGYGDWWLASKGNPWGVRSRFRGPQLHFRGGPFVNVHIDLNNPGDPPTGEATSALSELPGALRHLDEDLRNRAKTHTNKAIRAALARQGIVVPEVE